MTNANDTPADALRTAVERAKRTQHGVADAARALEEERDGAATGGPDRQGTPAPDDAGR